MALKLKPFQVEGVQTIDEFGGRALLADDMGLGKTVQGLYWYAHHGRAAGPGVVVCPAGVKPYWQTEASQHFGLRSDVLETTVPYDRAPMHPAPLNVVNYDIAHHWVDYLRRLKPGTVIIDESQRIQDRAATCTEAVTDLCKGVPHVIALSGTPLQNRPAELWPVLHILRPDIFGSFHDYAQRYCAPRRRHWGWTYTGATNLPELNDLLLDTCMIRRRKVDVLDDLPDKRRRLVLLDMRNRQEYLDASHDLVGWLMRSSRQRAKRAAKNEQLVRWGYLLRLAARCKLYYALERINRFLDETGNKLCVFGTHKAMLHAIARRAHAYNVLVDGDVTGQAREGAIKQFIRNPRIRLFIGNIRAAGTGINGLQSVCSHMMVVEPDWRPGALTQCEDRLWRMGQDAGHVLIEYLVAGDTIEEDLCRILQRKQKVIDSTLDGRGGAGLDIYDQLAIALEERHGAAA